MLVPNAWCLLAILAFACGDEEDKSDGPNRKAVKSGEVSLGASEHLVVFFSCTPRGAGAPKGSPGRSVERLTQGKHDLREEFH